MEAGSAPAQKSHRPSRNKPKKSGSGRKSSNRQAVAKPGAFARRIRLTADRSEKRTANPTLPVDRTGGDAAPRVVTVVGPKGVGKSTIIRNLVKHYSKRNVPTITGPITIVAGRRKRITFLEVGSDLSSMIDAAKVADLVLLVIDASYGFEMETFEFLNIAAAHGMPKIMAILTHLDKLRDGKQVRRAKKSFKDRIWAELYDGAKVFYLSGITTTGDYLNREVLNLARFISVTKYANIKWRSDHPYVLADRVEDITPQSLPPHANRSVAAYGYVRGSPLRTAAGQWRVHLAGVGDLIANNLELLPDPCPAPDANTAKSAEGKDGPMSQQKRKRRVSERERVVYAPMAPEVDGISYDRDAVYIDIAAKDVRFSEKVSLVRDVQAGNDGVELDGEQSSDGEGEKMVKHLQKADGAAVDESLKQTTLQLVKGGKQILSEEFSDGRRRRRVEFPVESEEADAEDVSDVSDGTDSDDSDSEEDLEISERDTDEGGAMELPETEAVETVHEGDSTDSGQSESDDASAGISEEGEGDDRAAQRWKTQTLQNAALRLQRSRSPSAALSKLIYGGGESDDHRSQKQETFENEMQPAETKKENSDDDAFFKPRRTRTPATELTVGALFSEAILDDCTRLLPDATRNWAAGEALCAGLRKRRFATGQAAGQVPNANDDRGSESLDGDFEDLETGEVHEGRSKSNAEDNETPDEASDADMEAIRTEKLKKKQEFDKEWDRRDKTSALGEDQGETQVNGDHDSPHKARKRKGNPEERVPDPRRVERDRLDQVRNNALAELDSKSRMALEGILPGQYIRMELQDVAVEFVKYFDPNYPVVLGGLKTSDDDGKTFIRARIRRHRFKRGVLKSTDPVVLSVGWRRFQSVPVYDTEDQGGRRRYLKYTPEYLHCNTTFWAPRVAPGAGLIMCQSLARDRAGFRIAGSGVVTEVDASFNIVKKLKLIGEPVKVHKNTAFVKGMFNSELEASRYIGASIRTVSGIRGTIKKAISEAAQRGALDRDIAKSPAGTFRAGFEDRILLSDIVFLRAWVPVEAPKFCSIATTLLDKERSGNGTWRMRTIREVREARQLPIPLNKDSMYTPIERGAPIFGPLKLSKKLEGSLPYASKPKNFAPKRRQLLPSTRKALMVTERAVVLEKKEKEEQRLLQAVYTLRGDRSKRRKEANERRLARRKKEWEREEAKHSNASAERRKRKFAMDGAQEARESKRLRWEE